MDHLKRQKIFARGSGSITVNTAISPGKQGDLPGLPEKGQLSPWELLAKSDLSTSHLGAISSSPATASSEIKADAAVDF